MKPADTATLDWYRFTDLAAPLLYDLLRFRQAIFVVEQRSPYPDLDGRDEHALHLVLRVAGTIAGYLRLIPAATITIGRVAVGAPWRGNGFARKMMTEALARAERDWPSSEIVVGAQSYLAPFYRSLGFKAAGTPYDDFGVPHTDMARPPATEY